MNPWLIRWLIAILLLANLALFFWPRPEPPRLDETVPRGVTRLVLLEELPPPVVVAKAEIEELPDIAEPVPEPVETVPEPVEPVLTIKTCWLAGPLDQTAVRETLTGALDTVGIQLNLVLQRVAATPDYWVHLPFDGDSQQRRRLGAELRQQGIDNFPITEGQLSGDLSLGLFRSEERARTVRSRVREQGYAAEIYERPRSREEAWAALQQVELAALGWAEEAGPLAAYPSVRLIQRDCPDR